MQLLISDANILIDLEEDRLLAAFFQLPYKFCVPDILFYEELEEQHGYLIEFGLDVREIQADAMLYADEIIKKFNGPSRNDRFALALARQEGCPLLTGDAKLRRAAEKEAVIVMGTLWAVEALVTHGLVSKDGASESYELMRGAGRRLPWKDAYERLSNLP